MSNLYTRPAAIFLMGPTASGKTELAVELSERLPVEVISVDSALVYREMDIGTAKPDPETLAQVPHRLIDFLDPAESYSAARFREDALREMEEIRAAGRIPLLVGGTMLYFRTLEQGIAPLPVADAELRRRLSDEAGEIGWDEMHRRLAALDPESARRIHPNDPQRLQRALEVYYLSGRPMSALWREAEASALPFAPVKLAIAPADRVVLRERIALRLQQMVQAGFIEEVERLYRRGDLTPEHPSIRCVGYRQIWNYLAGEWDFDTAVERAIIATRQLAKRQFTWLRKEKGLRWLESGDPNRLEEALKTLDHGPIA
ncbi:tRNA (adenosine(37)-N6)-dimethylallyltransferase MiaA [Thiohalomonas denitrificans]|uniref:tRNA dimethylallyltransferase n=1 Tax=Thiohalomonas denitrificans TaxID=415747 RepID=A0A1G5PK79_9GAMM|nr:tRNA (adenosine(37)-N6)-dimethylallyltransferase MiaA [Thiohalomonas denitrificans]SCZ49838.1 tRNA dimethylallyltransferase [Thiohalomonas denitrificans]